MYAIDSSDEAEERVVVLPHDADHGKAQDVGNGVWPEAYECRAEFGIRRGRFECGQHDA